MEVLNGVAVIGRRKQKLIMNSFFFFFFEGGGGWGEGEGTAGEVVMGTVAVVDFPDSLH